MKKTCRLISQFLLIVLCFSSCKERKPAEENASTIDVTKDWELGVAFWTFHTFSLPEALEKIDSSGLDIVEAPTFFKSGAALNDSLIGNLSKAGLEQVKALAKQHDLTIESMYIGGDNTVASWTKQFEIAKALGAKFVTAEPPVTLWDEVDSLAGVYDMKVAIHEHWKGVSPYWHPDSVLAAIDGHPNFGACADLGHWPKSGVDPLEAVKLLEGHIMAIHLKDIAAFDNPELKDVPVGTGVVDFPGIFAELKRQNFKGPIYIERDAEDLPSNLPSVMKTIQYYYNEVAKLK